MSKKKKRKGVITPPPLDNRFEFRAAGPMVATNIRETYTQWLEERARLMNNEYAQRLAPPEPPPATIRANHLAERWRQAYERTQADRQRGQGHTVENVQPIQATYHNLTITTPTNQPAGARWYVRTNNGGYEPLTFGVTELTNEHQRKPMRQLRPDLDIMPDAPIAMKNIVLPVNTAPGIAEGTPGNTVFSDRNEFKVNKLKRLVSVEIEIAGCKLPDYIYPVTKKWQCSIVEDQSLPRYGFEINSAPANGDKFVEQMHDFDEAFIEAGAWVNERCGLHTHADARDFNAYDVRRMIKLYSKLEKGLFEIVPYDRRHTKYATPCGNALMCKITSVAHPKTSKRRLIETLYTDVDDFKRLKETKAIDPLKRRRALNIHSWAFRKTFELRLPEGSVEAVDMVNWGILWGTIVDTAYKMGERMIDSIGNDSYQTLLDIAPTLAIQSWIRARIGAYK